MDYYCNDDYLDEADQDVMYSTRGLSSDSEDDSPFGHQKITKKSKKEDDSDGDFEKQMEEELSSTVLELKETFAKSCDSKSTSSTSKNTDSTNKNCNQKKPEYYNNIYFDTDESSDEESDKTEKKHKEKRKIISDDELLYDPMLDDNDEDWVEKNRKQRMFGSSKSTKKLDEQKLPNSDGVLSCPACFTTLSFDCQRHEVYKDQFRAMFVDNCYIQFKEQLSCPLKDDKKFRKRKRDSETPKENDADDIFYPVRCEECNTKVAVYDRDEVYHFFNVLVSS